MPEVKKGIKIELKSGKDIPDGSFKAIFSRFSVIDHDGDVTLPGAFQKGKKVPIAGVGHNWDTPVIGYGIVDSDSEKAWIDGRINLKMENGREHYESMKFSHENGVDQELSYAYDVLNKDAKSAAKLAEWPGASRVLSALDPKEVSMVLLGAGIGTGVMDVKSGTKLLWPTLSNGPCPVCGAAVASHTPETLARHKTTYASRSKGLKGAPLSDEEKRSAIQQAVSASMNSTQKNTAWSYPYITATFDDYVIVRDDDDEGYLKISYTIDDEKNVTLGDSTPVEQVWSEKSAAADQSQMKYADQSERVLAALLGFTDRSKSLAGMRAKIGRSLSTTNRERIAANAAAARAAADELEALLSEADPEVPAEELAKQRKVWLMKAQAELGELGLRLRN